MEMNLIFSKRKSNEPIKTQYKVTPKELNNPITRLYLQLNGVNTDKPIKTSARYMYFVVDGDKINKKPID